jgi:hypothetical protein
MILNQEPARKTDCSSHVMMSLPELVTNVFVQSDASLGLSSAQGVLEGRQLQKAYSQE